MKKTFIETKRKKINKEALKKASINFNNYLKSFYPKKKYRHNLIGPVHDVLQKIRREYSIITKDSACGFAFLEDEKQNMYENPEQLIFLKKGIEILIDEIRENPAEIKKMINIIEEEVFYLRKTDMFESVLTFSEAQELWGLGSSTLRKAVMDNRFNKGEIRKSGNTWLIKKSAMKRLYGEPQDQS